MAEPTQPSCSSIDELQKCALRIGDLIKQMQYGGRYQASLQTKAEIEKFDSLSSSLPEITNANVVDQSLFQKMAEKAAKDSKTATETRLSLKISAVGAAVASINSTFIPKLEQINKDLIDTSDKLKIQIGEREKLHNESAEVRGSALSKLSAEWESTKASIESNFNRALQTSNEKLRVQFQPEFDEKTTCIQRLKEQIEETRKPTHDSQKKALIESDQARQTMQMEADFAEELEDQKDEEQSLYMKIDAIKERLQRIPIRTAQIKESAEKQKTIITEGIRSEYQGKIEEMKDKIENTKRMISETSLPAQPLNALEEVEGHSISAGNLVQLQVDSRRAELQKIILNKKKQLDRIRSETKGNEESLRNMREKFAIQRRSAITETKGKHKEELFQIQAEISLFRSKVQLFSPLPYLEIMEVSRKIFGVYLRSIRAGQDSTAIKTKLEYLRGYLSAISAFTQRISSASSEEASLLSSMMSKSKKVERLGYGVSMFFHIQKLASLLFYQSPLSTSAISNRLDSLASKVFDETFYDPEELLPVFSSFIEVRMEMLNSICDKLFFENVCPNCGAYDQEISRIKDNIKEIEAKIPDSSIKAPLPPLKLP